jgi:drug/metabolite transporter (DMT)-like permease
MTHALQDARRGILAMILGGALFVINDSFVKLATQTMPTGQLIVARGIFAIACILAIIVATGETKRIMGAARPIVLLRAGIEFLITLFYVIAIAQLPISDLTAIMQATPIIMTIFVAVLRIEIVNWQRWLAVLVGFCGVVLITKPGGANFTWFTLSALISATFVAFRDLVTRKITGTIAPQIVIFTTTIFAMIGGLVIGASETWVALGPREYVLLASAAIVVSMGNMLMVIAYRNAAVTVLSTLRYLVVVWAAIMGYFVFGEWPDLIAALGTCLVVGSGLYTGFQERRRNQRAKLAESAHV